MTELETMLAWVARMRKELDALPMTPDAQRPASLFDTTFEMDNAQAYAWRKTFFDKLAQALELGAKMCTSTYSKQGTSEVTILDVLNTHLSDVAEDVEREYSVLEHLAILNAGPHPCRNILLSRYIDWDVPDDDDDDDDEPLDVHVKTNRERSHTAHRTQYWCEHCDAGLVSPGARCKVCHQVSGSTKKRKRKDPKGGNNYAQ